MCMALGLTDATRLEGGMPQLKILTRVCSTCSVCCKSQSPPIPLACQQGTRPGFGVRHSICGGWGAAPCGAIRGFTTVAGCMWGWVEDGCSISQFEGNWATYISTHDLGGMCACCSSLALCWWLGRPQPRAYVAGVSHSSGMSWGVGGRGERGGSLGPWPAMGPNTLATHTACAPATSHPPQQLHTPSHTPLSMCQPMVVRWLGGGGELCMCAGVCVHSPAATLHSDHLTRKPHMNTAPKITFIEGNMG